MLVVCDTCESIIPFHYSTCPVCKEKLNPKNQIVFKKTTEVDEENTLINNTVENGEIDFKELSDIFEKEINI